MSIFFEKISTLFDKKYFYFTLVIVGCLPILPELWRGFHLAPEFVDDAYYYILIARNYVELSFLTFDGVNPTNGFHPLWLLILVMLYQVIGADASLQTQILSIQLLEAGFYLGSISLSAIFAFKLQQQNNPLKYLFLGSLVVLLLPHYNSLFFLGMETTVATFIWLVLLYAIITQRIMAIAVLLPLLFLARLDTLIFIIAPLVLLLLIQHKQVQQKIIIMTPLILTVLTYLIWNYLFFGHLKPISGVLKSSFPWPTIHFSYLLDPVLLNLSTHNYLAMVTYPNITVLTVILIVTLVIAIWSFKHIPQARYLMFGLITVSILLILNFLLFQKWHKQIEIWYLVLPSLLIISLFIYTLAGLFDNQNILKAAILLVFVCCTPIHLYNTFQVSASGYFAVLNPLINFINNETDENTVLAATEGGIVAFFADRRYVNLDGLVNSFAYQKAIKEQGLLAFLQRNNVHYLLVGVWADKPQYQLRANEYMYQHRVNPQAIYSQTYTLEYFVYSYLYASFSEKISLPSTWEVYRSPIYQDGNNDACILIFDISAYT